MNTKRITAGFAVTSTILALLAGTLVGLGVAHASADPMCTGDTCVETLVLLLLPPAVAAIP